MNYKAGLLAIAADLEGKYPGIAEDFAMRLSALDGITEDVETAVREVKRAAKKALPQTQSVVANLPPPTEKATFVQRLADEVYAELGPGHTESVYHNAMKIQIQDAGFQYESERDIPVLFKGRYVGTVRADVIVNHEIVLEFKISGKMDDATLQCRQYMKLQTIPYGFVVLFPKSVGGKVVVKDCTLPDEDE